MNFKIIFIMLGYCVALLCILLFKVKNNIIDFINIEPIFFSVGIGFIIIMIRFKLKDIYSAIKVIFLKSEIEKIYKNRNSINILLIYKTFGKISLISGIIFLCLGVIMMTNQVFNHSVKEFLNGLSYYLLSLIYGFISYLFCELCILFLKRKEIK